MPLIFDSRRLAETLIRKIILFEANYASDGSNVDDRNAGKHRNRHRPDEKRRCTRDNESRRVPGP